jgi:hypothetical protein
VATKKKKTSNVLKNITFHYSGVEVDYARHSDCENHGCGDEGICRCSTLHDVEVTSIEPKDVLELVCYQFDMDRDSDILIYGIDRILKVLKAYEKDSYTVTICGGYYGEEIDGIYLENSDMIEATIKEFLSLSTLKKQVEYLLLLEYGHLLDKLKKCSWSISEVPTKSIVLGNTAHYKRLETTLVDRYNTYDLIRGVVKKNGNKYHLYDGYHRVAAMSNVGAKKIKVLVAK